MAVIEADLAGTIADLAEMRLRPPGGGFTALSRPLNVPRIVASPLVGIGKIPILIAFVSVAPDLGAFDTGAILGETFSDVAAATGAPMKVPLQSRSACF